MQNRRRNARCRPRVTRAEGAPACDRTTRGTKDGGGGGSYYCGGDGGRRRKKKAPPVAEIFFLQKTKHETRSRRVLWNMTHSVPRFSSFVGTPNTLAVGEYRRNLRNPTDSFLYRQHDQSLLPQIISPYPSREREFASPLAFPVPFTHTYVKPTCAPPPPPIKYSTHEEK